MWQNRAARLVTGTTLWSHITPVLRELHWLPVPEGIDFKILCMVYKALNGIGPVSLKAILHVRAATRVLRSAGSLCISPSRFSRVGGCTVEARATFVMEFAACQSEGLLQSLEVQETIENLVI